MLVLCIVLFLYWLETNVLELKQSAANWRWFARSEFHYYSHCSLHKSTKQSRYHKRVCIPHLAFYKFKHQTNQRLLSHYFDNMLFIWTYNIPFQEIDTFNSAQIYLNDFLHIHTKHADISTRPYTAWSKVTLIKYLAKRCCFIYRNGDDYEPRWSSAYIFYCKLLTGKALPAFSSDVSFVGICVAHNRLRTFHGTLCPPT